MLKAKENLSSVCPKQLCQSILLHPWALDLCYVSHIKCFKVGLGIFKILYIFLKSTCCFISILPTSAVEMPLYLSPILTVILETIAKINGDANKLLSLLLKSKSMFLQGEFLFKCIILKEYSRERLVWTRDY